MPKRDRSIDSDLARAPALVRALPQRLREDVHAACPDIVEAIKWIRSHWLLGGHPLCGMSASKAHCAVSSWAREGAGECKRGAVGDFGHTEPLSQAHRPGVRMAGRRKVSPLEVRELLKAPP